MRPESDWPLLLAGPMLRRVTRDSVAVFVAAADAVDVVLSIHDGVHPEEQQLGTTAPTPLLTLGRRLHVGVVEVTGLDLRPGHLYGYNLRLEGAGPAVGLGEMGLLDGPVALGYVPGDLPGFVLPGPADTLRIVHGSCRKFHGCVHATLVDPDVLPLVDRLVEDSRTDPLHRPQQLFLTGDQIYSDDVPAAVLAAAQLAGTTMINWTEELPLADGSVAAITDPLVAIGGRNAFLGEQGLKDTHKGQIGWKNYNANHLLFFAEWCALYLLSWSPELWPRTDDVSPGLREQIPDLFFHHLPAAEELWADSPPTTLPSLVLAQGLHFTRRALANVPTYMMFDDHDVTDDWFLNAKVDRDWRGNGDRPGPLGRRLMRNALTAYAIFQHWGNVPEDFRTGPGATLLEAADAGSGNPQLATTPTSIDTVLDVGQTRVSPDDRHLRMRWDWELVFDQHRVIAVDTRTWRGFPVGPRAPTEQEVAAAAAVPRPGVDWGPSALDVAAVRCGYHSSTLPPPIHDVLTVGRDLLQGLADLARVAAGTGGDHAGASGRTRTALTGLLDLIGGAPGTQTRVWAIGALGVAAAVPNRAHYAPTADVGESTQRSATALHEVAFRLRGAHRAALDELDPDEIYDEVDYLTAFEQLELLAAAGADLLESALYANHRGARHTVAVVDAWSTLAIDGAVELWGADGAAAEDVLWALAMDLAAVRADAADAAEQLASSPDPVAALLTDEDLRRNVQLISPEARVFQVDERVWDLDARRELTFVLSPAPVFGHEYVETFQRTMARHDPSDLEAEEEWENEPWSGNGPAMYGFLDALAPLGSVVLLSGDVHYAFSSATDYVASDGARARFIQLTSSSLKNSWAPSRGLEHFDDADRLPDPQELVLRLDLLENLPLESEWQDVDPEVRALVPTREQAREMIAAQREATGETGQRGGLLSGLLDRLSLRDALQAESQDEWESAQQDTATRTAEDLQNVEDHSGDPRDEFRGDRARATPDQPHPLLRLGQALGLDGRHLPEHHTSVLVDARLQEREHDSPGLAARLAGSSALMRGLTLLKARSTVGHANLGVITTQVNALGRFVTHDLHWFPYDTTEHTIQPDHEPVASFRDDWIITRHVAGHDHEMLRDCAGLVAAPAPPSPPDNAFFLIDVTSPGHRQDGGRRVHGITEATPTMPDLTVTVTLIGLTPSQARTQTRSVRLVCRYAGGNRDDEVYVPGPGPDDPPHVLGPGDETWRPVLPAQFFGGDLTVEATAVVGDQYVQGATRQGAHVIWGRNPSKEDIRRQADSDNNVDVVFHRESKSTQFADSASQLGPYVPGPAPVLRSEENSFGAGQLDDPPPAIHELWHWRANVDETVRRLNAFRDDARSYQAQVQNGQPWTAATGRFDQPDPNNPDAELEHPPPPNEGVPQDAPDFTEDQLDLEMWARYNGGRRYHDWDGQRWAQQPSPSTAVTEYAPEQLDLRRDVDAGNLPSGW